MTPEEFIRQNVDIRTAGIAHMLDSSFMRDLMNRYANHRVDEWEKKRLADFARQLDEMLG